MKSPTNNDSLNVSQFRKNSLKSQNSSRKCASVPKIVHLNATSDQVINTKTNTCMYDKNKNSKNNFEKHSSKSARSRQSTKSAKKDSVSPENYNQV